MSYRSSFSQYGGGRASPYAAPRLSQQDRSFSDLFEYVDPVDGGQRKYEDYGGPIEDDDAPDVLHVKYMGKTYRLEFPAYSISESAVTVQDVRRLMAEKLQQDPRRLRLIYKDRELQYDSYAIKKYHLKQNSEIALVVSEQLNDYSHVDNQPSSGEESSSTSSLRPPTENNKRNRANSTVRHRTHHVRRPSEEPSNGLLHPTYPSTRTERLMSSPKVSSPKVSSPRQGPFSPKVVNSPKMVNKTPPKQFDWPTNPDPPRPAPKPASPPRRARADPNSAMGKVQALQDVYYDDWLPECLNFLNAPPPDATQREKEYRRLSESVMRHVIEAADAIELQGDQDARTERKKVLSDAQELLRKLDMAGKR